MDEHKRLADRILKLLALASSTQFAAEAATAKRMADELMRTHNISLAPGKPPQDTIEMRYYKPFAKGTMWEGIIVKALCHLTGCTYFFDAETLASYTLVGSIWNLDICEYMLAEVNRQRMRAWLDYKGRGGPDSFHKFCYGYAKALDGKIDRLTDATKIAATHAALKLWYEAAAGIKVRGSDALNGGRASSQAGQAAGDKASLHRGQLGEKTRQIGYKP